MGSYLIQESGAIEPSLVKEDTDLEDQSNQVWELFFDGARSRHGSGGGSMLVSPEGERYYTTFRFSFSCTSNTKEYESLINGLEWARKRGLKALKVYGHSELVVSQEREISAAKNDTLKAYNHRFWDAIEDFCAFNIVAIPRKLNQNVDRLAVVGSQYDIPNSILKEIDQ